MEMNNFFLVLIAILLVLSGTFYFFYNRDVLGIKDEADFDSCTPFNMQVTEVKSTSFLISWDTVDECLGLVKYGSSVDSLDLIAVSDENNFAGDSHSIQVKNLRPSSVYYFVISSEGVEYGIDGSPVVVNTRAF